MERRKNRIEENELKDERKCKQNEREKRDCRKREWKGGRMEMEENKETLGRKELKGKRKGRQKERERRAFERENEKEEE
jgi:hypothetical protein